MSRPSGTGNPTPYSGDETIDLARAVADATKRADAAGLVAPTVIDVTASIEWSGAYNPRSHRTTRLDGLQLGPVLDAGRAYARAAQEIDRSGRAYSAQGWSAQLRYLEGTQKGRAAADAAGLNPARETLIRWLSGTQEPSKANRERIAEAYGQIRSQRVGLAASAAGQAADRVEHAVTRSLRDRYGAEIRLRDVSSLEFDR